MGSGQELAWRRSWLRMDHDLVDIVCCRGMHQGSVSSRLCTLVFPLSALGLRRERTVIATAMPAMFDPWRPPFDRGPLGCCAMPADGTKQSMGTQSEVRTFFFLPRIFLCGFPPLPPFLTSAFVHRPPCGVIADAFLLVLARRSSMPLPRDKVHKRRLHGPAQVRIGRDDCNGSADYDDAETAACIIARVASTSWPLARGAADSHLIGPPPGSQPRSIAP